MVLLFSLYLPDMLVAGLIVHPMVAMPTAAQSASVTLILSEESVDALRDFGQDKVVRVLKDKKYIKLEKSGVVSLAGIQFPKPSDCQSTTPNAKMQQLLPSGSIVKVRLLGNPDSVPRKAILIRESQVASGSTLQEEMISRGFATLSSSRQMVDASLPGWLDKSTLLEKQARKNHVGPLWRNTCDEQFEAQFEPLQYTIQTEWGADGGRPVRRQNPEFDDQPTVVSNPGDRKGCSDFATYEDSLRYYERYFPLYGDVAKLDRDGDGVPCPGLPHTKDPDRYRMKKPNAK